MSDKSIVAEAGGIVDKEINELLERADQYVEPGCLFGVQFCAGPGSNADQGVFRCDECLTCIRCGKGPTPIETRSRSQAVTNGLAPLAGSAADQAAEMVTEAWEDFDLDNLPSRGSRVAQAGADALSQVDKGGYVPTRARGIAEAGFDALANVGKKYETHAADAKKYLLRMYMDEQEKPGNVRRKGKDLAIGLSLFDWETPGERSVPACPDCLKLIDAARMQDQPTLELAIDGDKKDYRLGESVKLVAKLAGIPTGRNAWTKGGLWDGAIAKLSCESLAVELDQKFEFKENQADKKPDPIKFEHPLFIPGTHTFALTPTAGCQGSPTVEILVHDYPTYSLSDGVAAGKGKFGNPANLGDEVTFTVSFAPPPTLPDWPMDRRPTAALELPLELYSEGFEPTAVDVSPGSVKSAIGTKTMKKVVQKCKVRTDDPTLQPGSTRGYPVYLRLKNPNKAYEWDYIRESTMVYVIKPKVKQDCNCPDPTKPPTKPCNLLEMQIDVKHDGGGDILPARKFVVLPAGARAKPRADGRMVIESAGQIEMIAGLEGIDKTFHKTSIDITVLMQDGTDCGQHSRIVIEEERQGGWREVESQAESNEQRRPEVKNLRVYSAPQDVHKFKEAKKLAGIRYYLRAIRYPAPKIETFGGRANRKAIEQADTGNAAQPAAGAAKPGKRERGVREPRVYRIVATSCGENLAKAGTQGCPKIEARLIVYPSEEFRMSLKVPAVSNAFPHEMNVDTWAPGEKSDGLIGKAQELWKETGKDLYQHVAEKNDNLPTASKVTDVTRSVMDGLTPTGPTTSETQALIDILNEGNLTTLNAPTFERSFFVAQEEAPGLAAQAKEQLDKAKNSEAAQKIMGVGGKLAQGAKEAGGTVAKIAAASTALMAGFAAGVKTGEALAPVGLKAHGEPSLLEPIEEKLKKINQIIEAVHHLRELLASAPEIDVTYGFKAYFGIDVMAGEIDWRWGIKERPNSPFVYKWEQAGIDVIVVRLIANVEFGVKVKVSKLSVQATIFGKISLSFPYQRSWEMEDSSTVEKAAKWAVSHLKPNLTDAVLPQANPLAKPAEVEKKEEQITEPGAWVTADAAVDLGVKLVLISEKLLSVKGEVLGGYRIRARHASSIAGMEIETYAHDIVLKGTLTVFFKEKVDDITLSQGDPPGVPGHYWVILDAASAHWQVVRKKLQIAMRTVTMHNRNAEAALSAWSGYQAKVGDMESAYAAFLKRPEEASRLFKKDVEKRIALVAKLKLLEPEVTKVIPPGNARATKLRELYEELIAKEFEATEKGEEKLADDAAQEAKKKLIKDIEAVMKQAAKAGSDERSKIDDLKKGSEKLAKQWDEWLEKDDVGKKWKAWKDKSVLATA